MTTADATAPKKADIVSGKATHRRFGQLRTRSYWVVILWRLLILAVVLAAWQYLPTIPALSNHFKWMDSFFISSPSAVWAEMKQLLTGANNTPVVWPYLWATVEATLIGTMLGLALGTLLGAFLSNSERLARVLSVYITVLNAMPRIALIPVIIVVVGSGLEAAVVTCILTVTFLAFFNAYEGGRSVPGPVLQNATVLKANSRQVMMRVRFPYVLTWVFAVIPNAIAFGLITVVTEELLTGNVGMGGLMLIATTNVNASLSFSILVMMSVLGLVLVTIAEQIRRRVVHWA
jgi:NitT/TauT family transport system permease protein